MYDHKSKGEAAVESIRQENPLNVPNLLTLMRIALLPAVVWRFRRGDSMGALAVYVIAMLTDALDGAIARRKGQITSLGKLLDPLADKLFLLTLMGLFAADGQISIWLLSAVWIKEAILIAGSAFALRKGIVVSALPLGKATTLSFMLSMTVRFLGWRVAADALLGVSLVFSFAALAWYAIVLAQKLNTALS